MARSLLEETTFEVRETELDLDIPADKDAVYILRPLTTGVARAISKKHTRQEFDPRQHRKVDVVNSEAVNDAIMDHIIANWSGVGADGQAPCSLENKLKLPVAIQRALLDRAQVGDSAEVREQSFRQPA